MIWVKCISKIHVLNMKILICIFFLITARRIPENIGFCDRNPFPTTPCGPHTWPYSVL